VLVPIDFGHDVDAALEAAGALAVPYRARVVLLSAPEPPPSEAARMLPGASALLRAIDRDELLRRLRALEPRVGGDVAAVQSIVDDRSPAEAILSAAEELPADLIVLVTHAHGDLARWYDRSTAQRLLDRPSLTLLLIREP
jgi:nucleotide-binding universal stress UspA family protein